MELEALRRQSELSEMSCEKDLTSNHKLQLQRTQESNSNFILDVRDLNELLEERKNEISSLNRSLEEAKKLEEDREIDCGHIDNETLKRQIEDLDWELDFYRRKNEEHEIILVNPTWEYESLKEENHNKHVSLKLKGSKAGDEFSDSNDIIDELKSQIEILEGKLKQQSLGKERDEFERKVVLAKDEAKTAQKESTLSKTSNDEKETRLRNLKREAKGLNLQYSELQNSFVKKDGERRTEKTSIKLESRYPEKRRGMTKILDSKMG